MLIDSPSKKYRRCPFNTGLVDGANDALGLEGDGRARHAPATRKQEKGKREQPYSFASVTPQFPIPCKRRGKEGNN